MIYSLKHTDDMPKWKAGYSRAWFIRIRPIHKDDVGLLEHEIEHVRQWWVTLGISSIMYLLSKRYRLWAEVKAYKVQLRHPPATEDTNRYRKIYAYRLVVHYKISITEEEAYLLLG